MSRCLPLSLVTGTSKVTGNVTSKVEKTVSAPMDGKSTQEMAARSGAEVP
jgi:hypothetical protein